MRRGFGLAFFAAATLVAGASAADAATMLSVNPSSLCGEGGCFSNSIRTFQRTWSASEFQNAVSISALALDRSLLGDMQDYAVRISFQDASGQTVSSWGAFTVAVLSGQVVILGGDSIDWDASRGDLTLRLDLLIPDRGGVGGGGFFGGGGGGFGGGASSAMVAADSFGGGGAGAFRTPPIIVTPPPVTNDLRLALLAVPEPSAWALMLSGFMGAGLMLRRRRTALLRV